MSAANSSKDKASELSELKESVSKSAKRSSSSDNSSSIPSSDFTLFSSFVLKETSSLVSKVESVVALLSLR